MRDKILLRQLQALPLDAKILMTQQRIREWYHHFAGDVCISFSGGKDSTVLAHLVHEMYPDVPMVFANTGLEYPEIQAFARKMGAEFVRPKMSFPEVISKYGYPLISKEVAEAIHFARRIVAKNPGSLDFLERERERVPAAERRRAELDGTRDDTELLEQRRNVNPSTHSSRTGQQRGDEPILQTHCHTRELRKNRSKVPQTQYLQRERERVQTYPAGQTVAHGERLTGATGDESPLPG